MIFDEINVRAKELEAEMINLFQLFHEHPELSLKEYNTTKIIRELLVSWGITILELPIETGVVGLLTGTKPGPCVALRADIDALPILEQSGLTYCSREKGKMHACGHDTHIVMLLFAARLLSEHRDELCGSVKFIFQPGEESGNGSVKMIEAGALSNPKVDAIFGVHNYPQLNAGEAALFRGPIMAAVHWFEICITGVGAHAGMPQLGKDPIVAASALVQALQTIVSRSVDPLASCVVTVSSIRSGERETTAMPKNVIAKKCYLSGTCRCYSTEVEELLQKRFASIVKGIEEAYEVEVALDYDRAHPVTRNDEHLYEIAKTAAKEAGLSVVPVPPSTAGEDFSMYGEKIPAFLYWIGSGNPDTGVHEAWHSPKFTADPRCLRCGALCFVHTVFAYL